MKARAVDRWFEGGLLCVDLQEEHRSDGRFLVEGL